MPLEMYTSDCCDRNSSDRALNPRHLWSADDDERYRFAAAPLPGSDTAPETVGEWDEAAGGWDHP